MSTSAHGNVANSERENTHGGENKHVESEEEDPKRLLAFDGSAPVNLAMGVKDVDTEYEGYLSDEEDRIREKRNRPWELRPFINSCAEAVFACNGLVLTDAVTTSLYYRHYDELDKLRNSMQLALATSWPIELPTLVQLKVRMSSELTRSIAELDVNMTDGQHVQNRIQRLAERLQQLKTNWVQEEVEYQLDSIELAIDLME